MSSTHHVTVRMARGYEFVSEFSDVVDFPSLLCDEPPPLGNGRAPNAVDVLSAAVGNCLSASLAFCLRKSRVEPDRLTAHVTTHLVRNERGRSRISSIDVELLPEVAAPDADRLARCETLFEDFCTVAESVRHGIPVNVSVRQPVGAAAAAGGSQGKR